MALLSSEESLVIFSHLLEPPKPIEMVFYRCDSKFYLKPILEIFQHAEKHFLIVLCSGSHYEFHTLTKSGTHRHLQLLKKKDVKLQKKHRKGGQSSLRFSRLCQESHDNWTKMICEAIKETLQNHNAWEGILFAGPADFKRKVCEEFHTELPTKIITTEEITEKTVFQVVEQNSDFLISKEERMQNEELSKMKKHLYIGETKIFIGISELKQAFLEQNVKKVYLSQELKERLSTKIQKFNTCQAEVIWISKESVEPFDVIGVKYF